MERKTVTIFVDGKSVDVDSESNLVEACLVAGARIPTLCFMKDVSSNASCGTCVVEVEGAKALVRSCVQKPSPGMKIRTSPVALLRITSPRAFAASSQAGLRCVIFW